MLFRSVNTVQMMKGWLRRRRFQSTQAETPETRSGSIFSRDRANHVTGGNGIASESRLWRLVQAMSADSAVHRVPPYASFLHLLPLYASDATRPDYRNFNIALSLYDSITATLWFKAQTSQPIRSM